ncbi:MAG: rRNA maturation RNase YbeY [Deltaproteobacteria bacterium]|nr:rRNA maturation RNase YbeY [Deltaproteobacteria bacterium]
MLKVNLRFIKNMTEEILKDLGHADAELSLLLTHNNAIKDLNRKYLKKNRPTDVLAFPMYGKDGKLGVGGRGWKKISPHPTSHIPHPIILGDIAISVETAKLQAEKNSITLHEEISRLLIHGILHLLGFDHEKGRREAIQMRREEERLIERIRKKAWVRTQGAGVRR